MFNRLYSVIKEFKRRKTGLSSLSGLAKEGESVPQSPSTTVTPDTFTTEEDLIDILFKEVTGYGFINPRQNYDMYWIQKTMLEILDSYRYQVFEWVKMKGSAMDLVTRVWVMLDKVFDNMMVQTRR